MWVNLICGLNKARDSGRDQIEIDKDNNYCYIITSPLLLHWSSGGECDRDNIISLTMDDM